MFNDEFLILELVAGVVIVILMMIVTMIVIIVTGVVAVGVQYV